MHDSSHSVNIKKSSRESLKVIFYEEPLITVSEWAGARRVLSSESSPEPGQWHNDRVAYLPGMMDAFNDPAITDIVCVGNSQFGKTEVINNIVGYCIDEEPCPITVAHPTLEMARTWSKDRFAPMVRDTLSLYGKVQDSKSKDSDSTILQKLFPGGNLTISGANSPASLAGRPKRVVIGDDIDRWKASAGKEGDPIRLLLKRTTAFYNHKHLLFSTPTDQHSRIWKAFLETDQRYYFVRCPKCGEWQTLDWKDDETGKYHVKWERDKNKKYIPGSAYYECDKCAAHLNNDEINEIVKHGEWRATQPFNGKAGFSMNEIYSPWVTLDETVKTFYEVKNDPEQLKVWVNTSRGRIFENKGEAPQWERLFMHRERYERGVIPKGGLLLVAGADVQKDRIEVEIVAYGRGKESWSIDYRVFSGDVVMGSPFLQLDELMNETFRHESGGTIQIRMIAVDSSYATQEVYNWIRKYPSNRAMAVKGRDTLGAIIGTPHAVDILVDGKKFKRGIKYWPLGTGILKSELYGFLSIDKDKDGAFPPGYCHFPDYDEEFFRQLTAESLKVVNRRFVWEKDRERNEALDARNYARGAAAVLGMDVFTEDTWKALEAITKTVVENRIENTKRIRKKVISRGITV